MSNHGITTANLLRVLPDVLQNDRDMLALASGIADELTLLSDETTLTTVYAHIDALPVAVLDTLANDFKVDWWSYDYSLEEKRQTLKDSWYVHRHLGTKKAVERAISAIYPGTEVREWFDYSGRPYYFKLLVPVNQIEINPKKHSTVLSLVESYKNLRSKLEQVEYVVSPLGTAMTWAAGGVGCAHITMTVEVNVYGMD